MLHPVNPLGVPLPHAPCKILSVQQFIFLVSVKFHGDCHKVEVNQYIISCENITGFKAEVYV